jgi:hypothetical protein
MCRNQGYGGRRCPRNVSDPAERKAARRASERWFSNSSYPDVFLNFAPDLSQGIPIQRRIALAKTTTSAVVLALLAGDSRPLVREAAVRRIAATPELSFAGAQALVDATLAARRLDVADALRALRDQRPPTPLTEAEVGLMMIAASPSSTATRLIAAHRAAGTQSLPSAALAGHPHTPDDVRVVEVSNPWLPLEYRCGWAATTHDPRLIEALARDRAAQVLIALCSNPGLPEPVLRRLAVHRDAAVAAAAHKTQRARRLRKSGGSPSVSEECSPNVPIYRA